LPGGITPRRMGCRLPPTVIARRLSEPGFAGKLTDPEIGWPPSHVTALGTRTQLTTEN